MPDDVESTLRALEERLWRAQLSADAETLDDRIADDLRSSITLFAEPI
jgi:hypothetical protein